MMYVVIVGIYILLSVIVAVMGINRKFGFWGYLFASFCFTPFIGFFLVVGSSKVPLKRN